MTDPTPPDPAPESPSTAQGRAPSSQRALVVAAVLALFGLAVTFCHFLVPSPLMFTLFMTAGQGAFGLALAIYFWVIVRDLRRRRVL